MFEAQQLVFYTCVSPLHMGAGQAVGAIDNPIQREVHTGHPLIAGSGLKGAVRHHFTRTWQDAKLIARLFGPERDASEHAGAIAFTDAALVAFPVRSLKNTFVYATCPTALARLKRLAGATINWGVPNVVEGSVKAASDTALTKDKDGKNRLVLEAFDFTATTDDGVKAIAAWLALNALPQSTEHEFFRNKLKTDLVVLSDTEFGHFVRHATVVEAHVAITDAGTAKDGSLHYTENLPPEALLAGLVLASVERRKGKDTDGLLEAKDVLSAVLRDAGERKGLADRLLQVGGDATTGRGLIVVHPSGEDV